ncbi:E3 ubiquitin-protein ligase E3D-like [Teleopsis dalmanni]|uniref:E3 ubiquitin-protein ligase E3D-like n=1 Tax=Teleopsis dalmanni TaxID=139649 RepID=UPI0018CFE916|nr:E3 ubiquitin-protein ligase E3D-like [Teleopsis dalmanni]
MSLRTLNIEVRKNLHCANVFLQFDQNLTETEFLKINVEENALKLRGLSTETNIDVTKYFTIEAKTMSNLTVEECNASFRLSINNIQKEAKADQRRKQIFAPQLLEGTAATLCCANCECILINEQQFNKIREFPTGTVDMGQFFCHHGPSFDNILVPHTNDLFYGFEFIVLNYKTLETATKYKEGHIYCKRCLQYLGWTMFSDKAAKLWTDTLHFQIENKKQDIFYKHPTPLTSQLLQRIIKDATVDMEPLLTQIQFSKIVLQSTFPNRKCKYVLLQILEKELCVLRNETPLALGGVNNNNVLQVELEPYKSFKLLYRLIEDESEESKSTVLLNYWQQDISISTMQISPTLFSNLLGELDENSLLLPEVYRFTQDDFQLSYIFYKN